MIRLKIVGDVKYTCKIKIAHSKPVSSSNRAVKLKIVKCDPVNARHVCSFADAFTWSALFIMATRMQVSHNHWHESVVNIQCFLTLRYITQTWLCNKTARIWHILLWTCHCHFVRHHGLNWYLTYILISVFYYICAGLGWETRAMTQIITNSLKEHLILALYSVYNIKCDRQQHMMWFYKMTLLPFFFLCYSNYHQKLHIVSHEIKSNRNKLKSVEHRLSPPISALILLNALSHYVYQNGNNE